MPDTILGVRLKLRFHTLAGIVFFAAIAAGAQTAKKATAPAAKKSVKRVPVRVSPGSRAKGKATPKGSAPVAVYRAPSQGSPTPDRYREIQSALKEKGYLDSEPSGVWDQNSIAAMKRYQADQKIDATGKVSAKALISLGLGPKDESATTTANK